MSSNKFWNIILIGLAIGGFIWAQDEKSKRIELEDKLKQKDEDYLKLLSNYLNSKKELPLEIKEQLIGLRENYLGINDAVAIKLKTVIELSEENKDEIAIEKLTVIIENLLKEKHITEGLVKDRKSCPSLFKLLENAKQLNWITKHQFNFSLFLKDKRNDEVHELNVAFSENERIIAFISGLEIIYELEGIKRIPKELK